MKVAPRVETDEAASGDRRLDRVCLPVPVAPQRRQGLLAFWVKITDDWVFNLSGLLAYNFLMSSFPILILLLAGAGFALRGARPETQIVLQRSLANALPPPSRRPGSLRKNCSVTGAGAGPSGACGQPLIEPPGGRE